jgi:hypothetical protein
MRKLFKTMIAGALALGVSCGISLAEIDIDTAMQNIADNVKTLEAEIVKTKAKFDESEPLIVKSKEDALNAEADTDKMIAEMEALIARFEQGSETDKVIKEAKEALQLDIDKYRADPDPTIQGLVSDFQESMKKLDENDAERDKYVGIAKAEIRKLKSQKRILIVMRKAAAYRKIAKVYSDMLTSFKATVDSASTVTKSLESTTQIDSE